MLRANRCGDWFRLRGLAEQRRICGARDCAAQNRRHPEQPKLTERPASHKQRRTCAPRRINRRIRDRNRNQVNQRQAQPDRDRRKALRCACIDVLAADRMKVGQEAAIAELRAVMDRDTGVSGPGPLR